MNTIFAQVFINENHKNKCDFDCLRKMKKVLPKVNPNTYKVNPALDREKFEFTPETQAFREKIEKFIKIHIKTPASI